LIRPDRTFAAGLAVLLGFSAAVASKFPASILTRIAASPDERQLAKKSAPFINDPQPTYWNQIRDPGIVLAGNGGAAAL
jgi:hypothetical protein